MPRRSVARSPPLMTESWPCASKVGRDADRRRVAASKPVARRLLAEVDDHVLRERRPTSALAAPHPSTGLWDQHSRFQKRRPAQPITHLERATRFRASSWARRPARAAGRRSSCNAERKARSRTQQTCPSRPSPAKRSCSAWERSATTASESSSTGAGRHDPGMNEDKRQQVSTRILVALNSSRTMR